MKKLTFVFTFLFLLLAFTSKAALAANGSLDIDMTTTDGQTWNLVIGNNDGSVTAGSTVSLTFGAFWCNLNDDANCDDNSLDYRGLKTNQTFSVITPVKGQSLVVTKTFDIGKSEYPCGSVQADIVQSSGIYGEMYLSSSSCPMSAQLQKKTNACALVATWNVGYNNDPSCQVKIVAGNSIYQLSDTRCNGSWDSSVNSIPSGLSVHSGGIYQLFAGVQYGGQVALSCPNTPTPVTVGGKVTNASNATLPNVAITITNSSRGLNCTINTDSSGNFSSSSCSSSFSINSGETYSVSAPTVTTTINGTLYTSRTPSGNYTNQIAEGNPNCGTSCDFRYTPEGSPLTVTCSVTPSSGIVNQTNIGWSGSPSGGTPPYTYSWNFGTGSSCISPSSGCSSSASPTVKYTTTGTKNGSVTVTDSLGASKTSSNTCSVDITPASSSLVSCSNITMSANPGSGTPTFSSTISVALDTSGMPASKMSYWFCESGSPQIVNTSLSQVCTYSTSGTKTATFQVGDSVTGLPLSQQCSININSANSGICDPAANQSCTTSLGSGCTIQSSSANVYCQNFTGNPNAFCQYCLPPPTPPSCTYVNPPNDKPTVTLLPDGHTAQIKYTYPGPSNMRFYNTTIDGSNNYGFAQAGTGTPVANQFGNTSRTFDTGLSGVKKYYYYQGLTQTGSQSTPTNTVGIINNTSSTWSCSPYGGNANPSGYSARVISSTATTLTFELSYLVGYQDYSCGCSLYGCYPTNTPTHLKITRASDGLSGYIPWNSGSIASSICGRQCGGDVCFNSTWKAPYTIALPPNTNDTFYISNFTTSSCPNNFYGSTSFSGGTQPGTSTALNPNISGNWTTQYNGTPYIAIDLDQTKEGQQVKIYRTEGLSSRWSKDRSLNTQRSYNSATGLWTFIATENLLTLPPGTYYYGIALDLYDLVGSCESRYVQSDQTAFYWDGIKFSGNVYKDINNNLCASGATGLSGVSLTINPGGNSQQTNSSGSYSFSPTQTSENYGLSISGYSGYLVARNIDGKGWTGIDPTNNLVSFTPGNHTADFCINSTDAWIKTTGGDVHSNKKINTTGGP